MCIQLSFVYDLLVLFLLFQRKARPINRLACTSVYNNNNNNNNDNNDDNESNNNSVNNNNDNMWWLARLKGI